MKLFTCTQFTGMWPVGTAAVVYAENAEQAASLLNEALIKFELKGDAGAASMIEFPDNGSPKVLILNNGDY